MEAAAASFKQGNGLFRNSTDAGNFGLGLRKFLAAQANEASEVVGHVSSSGAEKRAGAIKI
jgi:hypothetical protein